MRKDAISYVELHKAIKLELCSVMKKHTLGLNRERPLKLTFAIKFAVIILKINIVNVNIPLP
jgi:hypothetical protein